MATQSERLLLIRERRFLLGLMFVAGIFALWLVRGYVAWAALGLLLGYICLPLNKRITKMVGGRKEMGAVITLTVAILAVVIPLGILAWSIASDVTAIVARISADGFPAYLQSGLERFLSPEAARNLSEIIATKLPEVLVDLVPELIIWIVDATVGIFILASALMAVLTKGDEIMAWLHRVVPLRPDREAAFFKGFRVALDAVIYGVIVVAAIQAVVGGLVWWIAGLPSVPFWTAMIFLFAMVPALGPSMVMLPGAIYAWATGNHFGAIVLLIGTFVAIGFIDYVVRPQIIKKKGDLDPTLALLSIVGGVATMGVIGIFVGPLMVAIFLKVTELTMHTHRHFGGDYDTELFEPDDPVPGEPDAKGSS